MDAITLDQFQVFVAIADAGSFAAAARKLHRAQSAITYAVQRLEEQIGATLFDRAEYRPRLTEAGRALLPQARRVLDDVGRFRSAAKEITRGLEAELRLSVAAMVPMAMLLPALRDFAATFPTVRLRIALEAFALDLAGTVLAPGVADLRVAIGLMLPDPMQRRVIGAFELIDVAAPTHPLAALAGGVDAETCAAHLQIVLTEAAEPAGAHERGVAAVNTWRVTDLDAKRALLVAGIGWGSLPDALAADDIAAGRLVALASEERSANRALRQFAVVAAHRRDEPLGPAGRWLLARLETPE